jgi:hypothetical protein
VLLPPGTSLFLDALNEDSAAIQDLPEPLAAILKLALGN